MRMIRFKPKTSPGRSVQYLKGAGREESRYPSSGSKMAPMRFRPFLIVLLLVAASLAQAVSPRSQPTKAPAADPAPLASHRVDFATQIQPILTSRCQPCHFPGGTMYKALPFDRAETVVKLREKLFTRLKDETERKTLREFLAENPAAAPQS